MSVEAAMLIPVVLTLLALLVQPACVLYTRAVMDATAGELVRLAVTSRGSGDDLRAYALRRLAAVPEVPSFHVGGAQAWEVSVEGPDEEGRVTAVVEGRVRPLPLVGVVVHALGRTDGQDVVVRAEAVLDARAEWIGGGYEDWVGVWE